MIGKRMKVSRNGQISIPANIRRRWNVRNVRILDEGDQIVVRPLPDDPIAAAYGAFAGRIKVSTTQMRRIARADELRAQERKYEKLK